MSVTRARLASFIEAVVAGRETDEEWFDCAVNHYHDDTMETARYLCVRTMIEAGGHIEHAPEADRARLLELAANLRKSESS